ncbi:unnamed protein product, partial [marine sediment metagenome]
MGKYIMINGRWKKPIRALLFLFIVVIWVFVVKAGTTNSQGSYQAKEAYTILQGTQNTALSQDRLIQVKGDSDIEQRPQEESAGASLWFTLLAIFLGGLA